MRKGLIIAGVLLAALGFASTRVCLSAAARYSLWLDHCPDGELRQTVYANGTLQREGTSSLQVGATAHYTYGAADTLKLAPLKQFSSTLRLVGDRVDQELTPKEWIRSGTSQATELQLPPVHDGDYVLRVTAHSPLGESTVELPLAFYTPARAHVLTDRPLYEPGNTVRFRALALKADDLSPLEGRPGIFRVIDPRGDVLLEEKAPTGPWGVVEGHFPLDSEAESGTWTVTWSSGATVQSRSFTVKPFTLPRFRIEAHAKKPFYRRHERPVLKGEVRYSSGAPVAKAKVELRWSLGGGWPAPTAWVSGAALPKLATTDASGAFSVELPAVPDDLQGQATLSAALAAIDGSGDRVEGSASVLLSEDAIAVSAVSELADGLVEGFNNRLYLRATTADGRVLEGASLSVKRLWEPTDKGVNAAADEDGVAALQIDPGPPVNVVIPPAPFRPPPPAAPVRRDNLAVLSAESREPSLADRLAFDRLEGKLASCTRYVGEQPSVSVGIRVSAAGKVAAVAAPGSRLGKCVGRVLSELSLAPGKDRVLSAGFSFDDSDVARLEAQTEGVPGVPGEVQQALEGALIDARDCLPPTLPSGPVPKLATWSFKPHARDVPLAWIPAPEPQRGFPEAAMHCLESRLSHLTLPRAHDDDEETEEGDTEIGFARFTVQAPSKYEAVRPQATTLVGYQFLVTAQLGGETLGSTKLLMTPGTIPNLRVRATPQLVNAGDTVHVDVLRGPDYSGDLPEKIYLARPRGQSVEAPLDPQTHKGELKVPAEAEGWARVSAGGAQVFVFVARKTGLQVTVTPDKERYAPGALAHLALATQVGSKGGPAAVGLFGVDNSLAQLVPLPGPGELDGLRPTASSAPVFPGLDAQALSMGRVRGANAAAATLLKVSSMPAATELETPVQAAAQSLFDPQEGLTDHFYTVLAELHRQVRDWESRAPAAEKMTPKTMAQLWNQALDRVQSGPDKAAALDAWGRRLRLHRLPMDLLALTEPRQVVVVGTRLPEDVENWATYIAKEKP